MNYFLSILFSIVFISANAQDSESIVQLRNETRIKKNVKSYSVGNMRGVDNFQIDSTYIKIDSTQLDFLKDYKLFDDAKLYYNYMTHTLNYGENTVLKQWIVPVKIFFDSTIDLGIVNDFKTYLKSFDSIPNLNISVVNDLESANYYFKIVNKEVSAYGKDAFKKLDDNELRTMPYAKMTYKTFADTNKKLTSCILQISPSAVYDHSFSDNLKKVFYYSLTQFRLSEGAPDDAILNPVSSDIRFLTEYDLNLISLHYSHIYDFKVDYDVMKALKKRHKALKTEP